MSKPAFSALRLPGYGIYLSTFVLTMMADNVEHVVSYSVGFVGGAIGIHSSMLVAAIALCVAIGLIGVRSTG
jgi:hypothetical protein